MAGIVNVCDNELAPIGSLSCSKGNPFLDVVTLLVFKAGVGFDTFVKLATKSEYLTLIKAGSLVPIHGVVEIEDNSEESQYYESPTGKRLPRRLGNYRHVFKFFKSLPVHKALQTFRGANVEIATVDSAGNICGWSPDGIKVRGFSVEMFNPEKMTSPGQDNTPAWTPIVIDQADPKEWNEKGISIKPGWFISELRPVSSVKLTVVSAAAAKIVVNVSYIDGLASDGSENKVGISGILGSDFVFTDTTPTAETMVDKGNGNYEFTGAGMVSGSVDLKPPTTATTVGDPIKSIAPAVITIP